MAGTKRCAVVVVLVVVMVAGVLATYTPAQASTVDRTRPSAPPGATVPAPIPATATTETGSAGRTGGLYYLALGDSVPVWNGSDSYPNQIVQSRVARNLPPWQLVNLACSSETTQTMMDGGICAYPISQYQSALAFLKAHRRQMALITIDIGGNDVVPCVLEVPIDTACIARSLPVMQSNLATMLAGLRAAAGPSTPIVGMNYYDPLLGDWLQGPVGQAFASQSVALLAVLNGDLADLYGHAGVPVANVQDAFDTTDLTTMVSSPWGTIPLGVERACTLLDIYCQVGQFAGFGDDPTTAGATVIASAFEAVIPACSPARVCRFERLCRLLHRVFGERFRCGPERCFLACFRNAPA